MILLKLIRFFLFLSVISSQTINTFTAYQTPFPYVTPSSCSSSQYYDIAMLQCSPCPANTTQKSTDPTQCDCLNTSYYYAVNQGGGSILCLPCSSGTISTDGFGCTIDSPSCNNPSSTLVTFESNLDGSLIGSVSSNTTRIGLEQCQNCTTGTWADQSDQRCTSCADVTPNTGQSPTNLTCCDTTSSNYQGGVCLTYILNIISTSISANTNNRFTNPTASSFFQAYLQSSLYLCRMNLNSITVNPLQNRTLLSNVTACHVLANIAAMQFYYPATNYAYYLYNTYIWNVINSNWGRPAIPFLAYPSSYYSQIINSSYNWLSATFNQNDLIRLKLAKYSPRGEYQGLVDAFDTLLQLCGGGYSQGRPAFTFGTIYKQTCSIRADALWNSTLYNTTFFDPYIVFTQSGSDYMLPTPIVIQNYQTETGATPNKNDDPSQWVYHRRFFLIDRISGIVNNVLGNIHYAKSIKILNVLTSGVKYIQPPVIIIEYDELSSSDIGKGTNLDITFETEYQMDLSSHIQAIWIAIGVISAVGIILAFIETYVWQTRAGKIIVDLGTIGKFVLYIINSIGTTFFIVMAGVSLWWLIFFKRQDTIYFVIPTNAQQASFTVLVVIAFVFKTIDILQLIIRQAHIDIFFIDWEKPKSEDRTAVSAWRSCFVANEYSEIQTFRRINLTFQLMFVLFLLKVINLENVAAAQPNTNLFPSIADYQAEYNGILHVGIAFSMWLGTALIQYFIYVIFYQRFVEDKILNFIDLCSVSNISVFILDENQHGYYIHGRSPQGTTDINMKEMLDYFQREENKTIGSRGLEANSSDQTFLIQIDRTFRNQFEILLRSYQHRILSHLTKKDEAHESEILLESYRNLNDFLCAFIEHSLPTYNYSVRGRVLFEKIFNCEFQRDALGGRTESIFYIDPDRNFIKTLFCGYENSLFVWNMATFLFVDYFALNYILAAIITYLLHQFAVKLRLSLGRKNLANKTLIPKNFLI